MRDHQYFSGRCCAYINKAALLNNLNYIQGLAPGKQIMAMVKGNAYGHGLIEVASIISKHVQFLGVAQLDSAIALRDAQITLPIVMLGGVQSIDQLDEIIQYKLDVVVHNFEQISWLKSYAQPVNVWLKIDTGMHRLGFLPDEVGAALDALNALPWVNIKQLMTHFGCADDLTHAVNIQQQNCWQALMASTIAGHAYSTENSMRLKLSADMQSNVIRPGIMLYGVDPSGLNSALKPVMTLRAKIIALKTIAAGDAVGYGARWRAQRPTQLAIIACGYGDGYPQHVPDGTAVLIAGQLCPLVGRVSMDMISVDVTQCSAHLQVGDIATLWGEDLPLETLSSQMNISPYALLTGVTERVHRVVS